MIGRRTVLKPSLQLMQMAPSTWSKLLEQFSPEAPFIFASTSKVYGDTPNQLPLQELMTRWEIEPGHEYEQGDLGDNEHRLQQTFALWSIQSRG